MSHVVMLLDAEYPFDPRVQNLAKALINNHFQVTLLCLTYSGQATIERIDDLKVIRFQVHKLFKRLHSYAYTFPFYHWMIQKTFLQYLKKHQKEIDIIHIHDMIQAKPILKNKLDGIHYTLDLHEIRPQIMRLYDHVKAFPGKYLIDLNQWEKNEKQLISLADTVVTVTDSSSRYYIDNYKSTPEKFITFSNTTDFDEHVLPKSLPSGDSPINLVYVGDTGFRRGIQTVLECLRELIYRHDMKVHFYCIGSSKYDSLWKSTANKLKITSHVTFTGHISQKEIDKYLANSNVGLSPLHRNIHHDTTLANKLFLHMKHGVPSIVSDCFEQAELVMKNNCGLVHKSQSVESLTEWILKLIDNEEEYTRMSQNSLNTLRKDFSIGNISSNLISLYKNIDVSA
jgi:glycosyltransferase involved in cell wall biosynthesis